MASPREVFMNRVSTMGSDGWAVEQIANEVIQTPYSIEETLRCCMILQARTLIAAISALSEREEGGDTNA